jgi:hypothetical protein
VPALNRATQKDTAFFGRGISASALSIMRSQRNVVD